MTTQNPNLLIEKELAAAVGHEFRCPDGVTYKLRTFEIARNGKTALYWYSPGTHVEIVTAKFWEEWSAYQRVDDPNAEVNTAQLAQVIVSPVVRKHELEATTLIDTSDVTKILKDQITLVRGNPNAIPQAKIIGDLVKQVIEANKLKLEAMKLVRDLNQPQKES